MSLYVSFYIRLLNKSMTKYFHRPIPDDTMNITSGSKVPEVDLDLDCQVHQVVSITSGKEFLVYSIHNLKACLANLRDILCPLKLASEL